MKFRIKVSLTPVEWRAVLLKHFLELKITKHLSNHSNMRQMLSA